MVILNHWNQAYTVKPGPNWNQPNIETVQIYILCFIWDSRLIEVSQDPQNQSLFFNDNAIMIEEKWLFG